MEAMNKKLGAVKLSKVTFRATNRDVDPATVKEPTDPQPSKGISNVKSSQNDGSTKPKDVKKLAPTISLRGLLAARHFTWTLKNRAALRRKSRSRTPNRKPVTIINEQKVASFEVKVCRNAELQRVYRIIRRHVFFPTEFQLEQCSIKVYLKIPAGSANPPQRFPYAQVKELIQEFLTARLRNVTYDPDKSGDLTKNLCEDIKKMVRRYTPPRYKLICNMAIGSKNREDILMTSQCLWDSYSDNVTSCSYENTTMFCVVTVYAVYFE